MTEAGIVIDVIGHDWKAPFSVDTVLEDHAVNPVGAIISFTTYSFPS